MKDFSYTARDTSGAIRKGSIRAVDRIAALSALESQSLIPISVSESAVRKEAFKVSGAFKTALLGGVALSVLMITAIRMMPERKPKAREQMPDLEKGSQVSVAPPSSPVVTGGRETPVTPSPIRGPIDELSEPIARPIPRIMQRSKKGEVLEPEVSTNSPRRHLSSGTEQVINMIVNTRPGSMPPPLLRLPPNENLAEILDRDILVYDDDTPQIVAQKANIAYAKNLLKEYLADGGNPETFFEHYHGILKQAFEERQTAQKFMMELVRAGDKKGASEYMTRKNKELEERGILPLRIPVFMR